MNWWSKMIAHIGIRPKYPNTYGRYQKGDMVIFKDPFSFGNSGFETVEYVGSYQKDGEPFAIIKHPEGDIKHTAFKNITGKKLW